jgi:hypothetical protein
LKVYKTKNFAKWASDEDISDIDLLSAVDEMKKGLIGTNLGGKLYKKRVARLGEGKSGGFRTFIGCKFEDKAFYLHGFGKNKSDNISRKEKKALKEFADLMLSMNDKEIIDSLKLKTIIEIIEEGNNHE